MAKTLFEKNRRIGKILWVMIFEENGSEQAPAPDVALVLSPVGMACEQALAWPTGLIPMPSATSLLITENCPSDIELLRFARIKSIRRYWCITYKGMLLDKGLNKPYKFYAERREAIFCEAKLSNFPILSVIPLGMLAELSPGSILDSRLKGTGEISHWMSMRSKFMYSRFLSAFLSITKKQSLSPYDFMAILDN